MMYLVMLRTGLDDVPIRIFYNRLEAEKYAVDIANKDAAPAPDGEWPKRHPDVVKALDRMGLEWCEPLFATVVKFRNNGLIAGFKNVADIVVMRGQNKK